MSRTYKKVHEMKVRVLEFHPIAKFYNTDKISQTLEGVREIKIRVLEFSSMGKF